LKAQPATAVGKAPVQYAENANWMDFIFIALALSTPSVQGTTVLPSRFCSLRSKKDVMTTLVLSSVGFQPAGLVQVASPIVSVLPAAAATSSASASAAAQVAPRIAAV
jgi:hypothetical protein